MKKIILIWFFFIFTIPIFASFDWQVFKTEQFTVFYAPGYEERALDLLNNLEAWKLLPETITGNKLYHVPVVLEDAGVYVQGLANPVYFKMEIFNYDSQDEDWFRYVAVHEYTHMLQMSKAGGVPAALSFIFGGWMVPNVFFPDWMLEGITTYTESRPSRYSGRINSGGFDAFIGAMVSGGALPDIMKATYAPFEAPYYDAPYIYGGEFMNYLSKKYGEDKFRLLYNSYGSSALSYASPLFPFLGMDRTFKEIYGKGTQDLWKEWALSEAERFKDYKMEGENISNKGFYVQAPLVHNKKLYYVSMGEYKTGVYTSWGYNDIIERDLSTGKEKIIVSRTSSIDLPLCAEGDKLYYGIRQIRQGYPDIYEFGYGYTDVIYEKDLATGNERELFCAAVNAFCAAGGKVFYSSQLGKKFGSLISVYDIAKNETRGLFEAPYTVYGMAMPADGKKLAVSAKKERENLGIYMVDLDKKEFTELVNTPWSEESPAFYGEKLFYTSNINSVNSVYCYDFGAKKISRLTSGGTALGSAYDESAGELYFIGLNLKGFDVYKKKAEFTGFDLPEFAPENQEPAPQAVYTREGYLANLLTPWPAIRLPYADYDGERASRYGVELIGMDALEDFSYDVTAAYDSILNRFSTNSTFAMLFLRPAVLKINYYGFDDVLELRGAYTFFRSLTGGLSLVDGAVTYGMNNVSSRKKAGAEFNLGFTWLSTKVKAGGEAGYEGPQTGSPKRINTYGAHILIQQRMGPGYLEINGKGLYSSDRVDDVMPYIRGYKTTAPGNAGSMFSAEYFFPVLSIHGGIWNPVNIFFQDVIMSVFCDSAFSNSKTQVSGGLTAHLETMTVFILPLDIGVGAAISKEGHVSYKFLFTTNL